MIELVFNSDMELINDVDMSAIPWAKITSMDTEVFVTIHAVGVVHARVINVYTSENEDYITCIFNMGDKCFSLGINTATGESDINDITPDKAIKLKSGLSSADVGDYGEKAYIFINKNEDSNGLFYEWDIELLPNYLDILNTDVLGVYDNHIGRTGIIIGGNVQSYQSGCQNNFGIEKIDDVWGAYFYSTHLQGSDPNLNATYRVPLLSGRHTYLLGDSSGASNGKKIGLFNAYDFYRQYMWGSQDPANLGHWATNCPAHYTPFFKIYSLKMWSDADKTNLLHHYVPKIDSDHIGVMDIITNTFYPCSNDNFFELVK